MKYPRHLNTRDDVLYVVDHFPREKWAPDLERMLEDRFQWLPTGRLDAKEVGVDDDTRRVVENLDDNGIVTDRYQERFTEDPNAKIFRLGMTVAEVEKLLVR